MYADVVCAGHSQVGNRPNSQEEILDLVVVEEERRR